MSSGDRNDNLLWMLRDTEGTLRGVVDANGRVLWSLHYNEKQLLTAITDYPVTDIENDLLSRSVNYKYDDKNRLIEVHDPRGHVTRYGYDAGHRIIEISDPEGRLEQLSYNGNIVKQRIAADGGETDYSFDYDETNKQFISKVTGPETAAGRRVDDYTHNRVGKLVLHRVNGRSDQEIIYDTGARTRIITNARGFVTRRTTNEFEQWVAEVYPDGSSRKRSYSALHLQLTAETDPLGIKTEYAYDARGNLLKETAAVGRPEARIIEYQRNHLGQLSVLTHKGRTEENGMVTADAVWELSYDAQGQVSEVKDPEGHVWSFRYDRSGNLLAVTDPDGNKTEYEVDAGANLVKVTDALNRVRSYGYDQVGNRIIETDARGKTREMVFDAMNRMVQSTSRTGGVSAFQYNAEGLLIAETDADGRKMETAFDNFLRLSRQTDGMGNQTEYSYALPDGGVGSLFAPTQISYPTFTLHRRYDRQERPSSQTLDNHAESFISSLDYDQRGQVVLATDARGKTRSYGYDALGQLTGITDSLGNKTGFQYDARGNLIQVTDARGKAYRFEFDRNNRVIKEILPLGQSIRYQYDASGNRVERIDAKGQKAEYHFDAARRLITVRYTRADGFLERTSSFSWDAEDNLTAWSDTDHRRNQSSAADLVYDAEGRKTQETLRYADDTKLGYQYSYSPAGYKTGLIWADGTQIDYSYSAHGKLKSVSIPDEGDLEVAKYHWLEPSEITLPGGGRQNRSLDGLLYLKALEVKTPEQETSLSIVNTWGKVQELQAEARVDTANGVSSSQRSDYSYDDEMRLTEVQTDRGGLFSGDTEGYTLDAVGNRIAHSAVGGSWT